MKKQIDKYWFISAFSLIAFQSIGFSQIQNPDSATVTFKVNTAFVTDILNYESSVSIRGGAFGGDWTSDKGINLTNRGGDYWEGMKKVPVGPSGGDFKVVTQTEDGIGWDQHQISQFTIEKDTTLELFTTGLRETYIDPITGDSITRGDDWNPLELAKRGDTSVVAVHFRVNMYVKAAVGFFNPETHFVFVRGSFNEWTTVDTLFREERHNDLGSVFHDFTNENFYSKTILIPKSDVGIIHQYRFTFGNSEFTTWEDQLSENRKFTLNTDTTLVWKWFEDYYFTNEPYLHTYSVQGTADLSTTLENGGFNPETDSVFIRIGMMGTAMDTSEFKLERDGKTTVYSFQDSVELSPDIGPVFYQYYLKTPFGESKEIYTDFSKKLPVEHYNEFRKIQFPDTGQLITILDTEFGNTSSTRQPVFKSLVPMTDSTNVIFHVDLRPVFFFVKRLGDSLCYYPSSNYYITSKTIDLQRLYWAAPNYCWWCWGPWAPPEMNDKGLDGDNVAGDSVYSITVKIKKGELSSIEYQLSFGWGPNESSFLFTRFHNLEQKPVNEFSFQFGDIEPDRYRNDKGFWDFNAGKGVITSIEANSNSEKPNKISISAYPNPFNPATLISYSIPQSGKVSLKVFDLLGRQVAILAEEIKPAGTHQIPFRGDDLASGIYMVRMKSGSKTESVKVVLLK